MILWSHWSGASLLLKDSPLMNLCCWQIWKTYFEASYRIKLVLNLQLSMFYNSLNFCYKKFLIWWFKIDLSNFCVIQFHKSRIFKCLRSTGLTMCVVVYEICSSSERGTHNSRWIWIYGSWNVFHYNHHDKLLNL